MLRSLLTAFRQHYPQGSLVSDLICVHDGLYLVRVAVMVEDRTLATGLAAHSVLETAEDTAYLRALGHIGSPEVGDADSPPWFPQPSADSQPASKPVGVDNGFRSAPVGAPLAVSTPFSDLDQDVDQTPLASEPPSLGTQASPTPPDTLVPPPLPPDLLSLGGVPTPSVDLSDIIAQTDVELQRLGWTVTQGREFLEKTYSKRSRHELTDEELLEFLLFLETQVPPRP